MLRFLSILLALRSLVCTSGPQSMLSSTGMRLRFHPNYGALPHYSLALLCTLFLASGMPAALGQTPENSPPSTISNPSIAPSAGHDPINLLSESVSPATGSVNLEIKLPVPSSRGITIPFSFSYNSGQLSSLADNGGTLDWRWRTADSGGAGWENKRFPYANWQLWQIKIQIHSNQNFICNFASGFTFTDSAGSHAQPWPRSTSYGPGRFAALRQSTQRAATAKCKPSLTLTPPLEWRRAKPQTS